jgi:superfamily II DNA or RNA helicase
MTAALSYSVQQYGRSIVIVPNKSLVVQTEFDYKNIGLDVGVYFGDRKEIGKRILSVLGKV